MESDVSASAGISLRMSGGKRNTGAPGKSLARSLVSNEGIAVDNRCFPALHHSHWL